MHTKGTPENSPPARGALKTSTRGPSLAGDGGAFSNSEAFDPAETLLARAVSLGIEIWLDHPDQIRFRAPKGVFDSGMQDDFRRLKPQMIEALRRQKTATGQLQLPRYLTRFWKEIQQGDLSAYFTNVSQFVLGFEGRFDIGLLNRALEELGRRHPMLNSRVTLEDDGPTLQTFDTPLAARQLDNSPSQDPVTAVRSALWAPFDLEMEPLLRCVVAHDGAHDLIGVVVHHFIIDGSSLGLLLRELLELYEQLEGLIHPSSPDGRFGDFREFLAMSQAWIASPEGQRVRREYLADFADLGPCTLPSRSTPPTPLATHYTVIPFAVHSDLWRRVRSRAAEERAPPYAVVLAAKMRALAQVSGQSDISVLTLATCRAHPQFERTIGPMINVVPVRLRMDPQHSASTLVEAARIASLKTAERALYPFECIRPEIEQLDRGPQLPLINMIQSSATGGGSSYGSSRVRLGAPRPIPPIALRRQPFESHYFGFYTTELEAHGELRFSENDAHIDAARQLIAAFEEFLAHWSA